MNVLEQQENRIPPVTIFYSYATEDEHLQSQLKAVCKGCLDPLRERFHMLLLCSARDPCKDPSDHFTHSLLDKWGTLIANDCPKMSSVILSKGIQCHSERSEESRCPSCEILRFAQNDTGCLCSE